MSFHTFDPEVAADVGLNAAVIYRNIQFWIDKNRANKKHEYNGHYWTYNSMAAFSHQFIYLSKDQVRRALDRLCEFEYLAKGNFNKTAYDRTLWYCDLRHVHVANSPNGSDAIPSPIPNSKPDSNTDTPQTPKGAEDWKPIFEKLWKYVMEITPQERKGRHSKKTAIRNFQKIVTRKKDPISASRVANAVCYFYDQEDQKKKDNSGLERGFMKGLAPVLNQELFFSFLQMGSFNQMTPEQAEDEAWIRRAKYLNETGEWPQGAPSPLQMPKQLRVYVDKKYFMSTFTDFHES